MYIAMNWIIVLGVVVSSFFLYFDKKLVPRRYKEVNFQENNYSVNHEKTIDYCPVGFLNVSENWKSVKEPIVMTKTSEKQSVTLMENNRNFKVCNNTLIDYFYLRCIHCQTCVGTTFDITGFEKTNSELVSYIVNEGLKSDADTDGYKTRKEEKYAIAIANYPGANDNVMPTKKSRNDCPCCEEAITELATNFRTDILLCCLLVVNYLAITIVSCLYFRRA